MPKLINAMPKFRRKKKPGGDRAVVTIGGEDHYLGPYGSKASKILYDRLICEWLSGGRNLQISDDAPITDQPLLETH